MSNIDMRALSDPAQMANGPVTGTATPDRQVGFDVGYDEAFGVSSFYKTTEVRRPKKRSTKSSSLSPQIFSSSAYHKDVGPSSSRATGSGGTRSFSYAGPSGAASAPSSSHLDSQLRGLLPAARAAVPKSPSVSMAGEMVLVEENPEDQGDTTIAKVFSATETASATSPQESEKKHGSSSTSDDAAASPSSARTGTTGTVMTSSSRVVALAAPAVTRQPQQVVEQSSGSTTVPPIAISTSLPDGVHESGQTPGTRKNVERSTPGHFQVGSVTDSGDRSYTTTGGPSNYSTSTTAPAVKMQRSEESSRLSAAIASPSAGTTADRTATAIVTPIPVGGDVEQNVDSTKQAWLEVEGVEAPIFAGKTARAEDETEPGDALRTQLKLIRSSANPIPAEEVKSSGVTGSGIAANERRDSLSATTGKATTPPPPVVLQVPKSFLCPLCQVVMTDIADKIIATQISSMSCERASSPATSNMCCLSVSLLFAFPA